MSRSAAALDQPFVERPADTPSTDVPGLAAATWQSGFGSLLGVARGPCDGLDATGEAEAMPDGESAAGCVKRSWLADHAVWAVPIGAALALAGFVFVNADPGAELALLAVAAVVLVAGHLLLRSRTRRVIAEHQAARIRQELDLRARVAECESRRMRLAAFSRLAAQIAHEVRNPLASIVLNTELLEEEIGTCALANGEMRALVRSIKGEAERLHALTDEYLAFARLPEADRAVHSLNKVVVDLVQFVTSEARQHHIAVRLSVPAHDLEVWMDPRQVRQVLLNLMRNAVEAMPHGGRLDLLARVEGHDAVVEVCDSGPGIPVDQRALVFEPFFSTKPHGTGLGLALARRIAEEHGGALDLVPAQVGACFRVRLPLADRSVERVPALAGVEGAP